MDTGLTLMTGFGFGWFGGIAYCFFLDYRRSMRTTRQKAGVQGGQDVE